MAKSTKRLLVQLSNTLLEKAGELQDEESESEDDKEEDVQESPQALLARARKLSHGNRKRQKRPGKGKQAAAARKQIVSPGPVSRGDHTDSDIVHISVCVMKESLPKPGVYTRASHFLEIQAQRCHSYSSIVEVARQEFGLQPSEGKKFALFRHSGVVVCDTPTIVKGVSRKWSLGSYLLACKKSPTQVKFGIGELSTATTDRGQKSDEIPGSKKEMRRAATLDSGLDSAVLTHSVRRDKSGTKQVSVGVEVTYAPGQGITLDPELNREGVWLKEGESQHNLDKEGVYHPENDGWSVVRVKRGEDTLLMPLTAGSVAAGFTLPMARQGLDVGLIAHESPGNVVLKSLRVPVPLYCISHFHGLCSYQWGMLGHDEEKFPETPVVYVRKVGLYQCTVTHNSKSERSRLFSLEVKPEAVPTLLCEEDTFPSSTASHARAVVSVPSAGNTGEVLGSKGMEQQTRQKDTAIGVLELTEEDVKQATDNFDPSRRVGKGGFGEVFQGYLRSTKVAVKLLNREGAKALHPTAAGTEADESFATEVLALTKFRHQNLVELMGFCSEPQVIVYELMEQGSLYSHLHVKVSQALTWIQRCRILKDTCRGLAWLHGSKPPMIHQDVKTANILLDAHFNAKLGDFGFATELPRSVGDHTLLTAKLFARTEGYYAPELVTGKISPKSDVYSYGVVVLETHSGQKSFVSDSAKDPRPDMKLVDHLEDSLKSLQAFKEAADGKAGPCAHYLSQMLYNIVTASLVKHSKRVSSEKIMEIWSQTNF